MKDEIIIAGYGGQGVVLAGSLLAHMAMNSGLETCSMVSYGVEMRGGAANSTVIISTDKISSPVVVKPNFLIVMSQDAYERFHGCVAGTVIADKAVRTYEAAGGVVAVNAMELAEKSGSEKAMNMVMVGVYLGVASGYSKLDPDIAQDILKAKFKGETLKANVRAIKAGYDFGKGVKNVR